MRLYAALLILGLTSNIAIGANIANQVCPSLSSEGSRLVTGIQSLQENLKKSPECQSIAEQLGTVNEVIANPDWKVFKELLSGSDVESLEKEQIEVLTDLASRASNSLAQTIGMLNGSGANCVDPSDKPSFLGILSGVTKEVSTLVGQATGPYGMAISLGGNIISSAISGIDDYFKAGRSYNFNNKDEEMLFMNQFCSFVEAKKDVADFVKMDKRIEDLDYLEKYLDKKLDGIYSNCEECVAYEKAYNTKKSADKIVKQIISDVQIKNSVSGRTTSTSRCVEIARAIHAPESDLEALMNVYDTYENPMMSKNDSALIEYMLEARTVLKEVFPGLSDCWRMSQSEIEAISQKFNDFMRDDILHLNETLFAQQLSTLRYLADKTNIYPLGEYTANSLERKEWTKKEKSLVDKKLNDPNRDVDLSHVRELHEKLEERIAGFLMPSYLNFLVNKNKYSLKSFNRDYYNFKRDALRENSRKLGKNITSLSELTEILMENKIIDGRVFLSKYRSTFDKLSIALSQRKTIHRYCEYVSYTSTVSSKGQYVCEVRVDEITSGFDQLDKNSDDFKALSTFNDWANKNLDLQSSRVRDYADMIREWNSRGDERWRKKPVSKPREKSLAERIELADQESVK